MVSPIPNSELKNLELDNQKGLGLYFFQVRLGVVHKLYWQDSGFFDHLPLCVDIFYSMNDDKKWTF